MDEVDAKLLPHTNHIRDMLRQDRASIKADLMAEIQQLLGIRKTSPYGSKQSFDNNAIDKNLKSKPTDVGGKEPLDPLEIFNKSRWDDYAGIAEVVSSVKAYHSEQPISTISEHLYYFMSTTVTHYVHKIFWSILCLLRFAL